MRCVSTCRALVFDFFALACCCQLILDDRATCAKQVLVHQRCVAVEELGEYIEWHYHWSCLDLVAEMCPFSLAVVWKAIVEGILNNSLVTSLLAWNCLESLKAGTSIIGVSVF